MRNGAKYAAALRQRAALAQIARGLLLPAAADFCALARKNVVEAVLVRSCCLSLPALYMRCPLTSLPGCCPDVCIY